MKMNEDLLSQLKNTYRVTENDLGEDAKLSAKGMTFRLRTFEAEGLGHVCLLSMSGMLGVSSMYRGALERDASLVSSCCQSHGSSLDPPLSFSAGSPDSVVIRRITSCNADISSENTATGILWSTAALRA